MAVYAIGDVQGCYDALRCLLDKIKFDRYRDTLWFAGDLVNRGGQSLQTLEYIYSIRDSVVCVLGNHDLHLIAAYYGHKLLEPFSDMLPILKSPDAALMIDWLRHQPLMHSENGWALVHAGIAPMWSVAQARACAREVEAVLQGSQVEMFIQHMYGSEPSKWNDALTGMERLRCITNYFTRMRFVYKKGRMDFSVTCHPDDVDNPKLHPWFALPERPARDTRILFGHWAALMGQANSASVIALDTGSVWGGSLTAFCLDTGNYTHCYC